MVIPFTLLFGAIGYLVYKSKSPLSFAEVGDIDTQIEQTEEDDLYKDLEDLFI